MSKIRLLCLAYFACLSVLLLAPDPLMLLGVDHKPDRLPRVGVHFSLFVVLGLLVAASRFPLRGAFLATVLIGYATVVELLQSLVPQRTVELRDWIENLLGLACAAVIWMALEARFRPGRRRDR